MDMTQSRPTHAYQAFVVRCWVEHGRDGPFYRFCMLELKTGRLRGAATLNEVTAVLAGRLDAGREDDLPGEG